MSDQPSQEESLYEKLKSDIDNTKWELLSPHHERNAAFLISHDLELLAVGVAMARDESKYIKQWINEQKLTPPTEEQVAQWNEEDTEFKYLIIQPYVIFQVAHHEDVQ